MDIRQVEDTPSLIRFADPVGGTHQGTYLTCGFVQVNIHRDLDTQDTGGLCHIKFEDIDHFIRALRKAQEIWGNNKGGNK